MDIVFILEPSENQDMKENGGGSLAQKHKSTNTHAVRKCIYVYNNNNKLTYIGMYAIFYYKIQVMPICALN